MIRVLRKRILVCLQVESGDSARVYSILAAVQDGLAQVHRCSGSSFPHITSSLFSRFVPVLLFVWAPLVRQLDQS